jgi:hypothetical protein
MRQVPPQQFPPQQGQQVPQQPSSQPVPQPPQHFAAQPPAGYGYPNPAQAYPPAQQPSSQPDWEALAQQNEATQRRRGRWRTVGIVAAAAVLGVVVGGLYLTQHGDKKAPVAEPSHHASSSPSASPSVFPPDGVPAGTVADYSGGHPLQAGPNVRLLHVNGGEALKFDGSGDSYVQSAAQVVDVHQSFTVSAWVSADATGSSRAAVSQGDGSFYSFDLGLEVTPAHKAWVFKVQSAAGNADSTIVRALSTQVGAVGDWTLLTGVYDAQKHTISLYVNGTPAATTKAPGVWAAPGSLQLARARYEGVWEDSWAGVVGTVEVWNRPLTAPEVAALKGGHSEGAKPVDAWLAG